MLLHDDFKNGEVAAWTRSNGMILTVNKKAVERLVARLDDWGIGMI